MTRPDIDRSISAWLEDQASDRAPDTLLEASRERIHATRQRRAWVPAWRIPPMNVYAKFAIAAAAVLVIAVAGLNLLPRSGGIVGSGPAVTPSPSPTPSPIASPSPAPALNGSPYQSLQAGATYRQAEAAFTKVPFTFTVPDGWRREDGNFITKGPSMDAFTGNGVGMAPWIVSHVYADACDWEGTLHATSTVAELTDALRTQKGGVETTGPTVTTIGGRPANRLEISLPADADLSACDQGFMRLWPDAGPDERYGWPIAAGQMLTVYVVDLDGAPQLIAASRKPDSSDTDVAELQQVIESIRFE
jgi:hypothetical protein